MTPTAATLQFELEERFLWFQNSWFFKWHQIGGQPPVEIDMFDGSMATYSGLAFSGTVRDIFWQGIVHGVRREVELRLRWLDGEVRRFEPSQIDRAIDEGIGQLISFVERVRSLAVEKFRILCGNGLDFPSPVDRGFWNGLSRDELAARGEELKRAIPHEQDQLNSLVQRPSESIAVELKTWIDPRMPEGAAKIAKAAFAMWNRDGGFVVIGFDDKTGTPDAYQLDAPATEIFHADAIQQIISRHASTPFPIEVALRERDGQAHPVIVVPPGIRIPVVVKSALNGEGGKQLLREGELYFRTLRSNGTPSSALIRPGDWPDLMDICFNNREGDIGGFFRRQLGGADRNAIATVLRQLVDFTPQPKVDPADQTRKRATTVIEEGQTRFAEAIAARGSDQSVKRAIAGLTMHVGLALEPERTGLVPTRDFLNTLAGANPQYTGWPIWLDARSSYEQADRPVVQGGAWETLIVDLDEGFFQHLEFMRLEPGGSFYLRRAMQDDFSDKVEPGKALDIFLMLIRVAETLAVGVSFGRALGWEEHGDAGFAFTWTSLDKRRLLGWANPLRSMGMGGGQSNTAEVSSTVLVPLETPPTALAPYVTEAVAPLFAVFDGYQPSAALVEDAVRRLVDRKLS